MSFSADPLAPSRDGVVPYSSLPSLKEAHAQLLRYHRQDGETDEVLAAVDAFIRQGTATGALLDAYDERSATQSLLDYWVTVLYRAKHIPPDATLAEFDPALAPSLDDADCPYLGLSAFQEKDYNLFFGRRQLIENIIDHVKMDRFVAVLGPSGSGKSSVVLAGLIPLLKQGVLKDSESWTYFSHMVPEPDSLRSLALLLKPDKGGSAEWLQQQVAGFRHGPQHLVTLVEQLVSGPAVVVVDQFEEVFTLCGDENRRAFVDNLLALAQAPSRRHLVVVTMRTDFETQVAHFPELQRLFQSGEVRVTPLGAVELREAIEEPANHIGLKFEGGVIDELVRDILGEPAGLPLLQFTLLRLWKSREGNRVTWKAYKGLGDARRALAVTADEFYERLIHQDKETARRILLRLARPSGGLEVTSNRVRRETLYKTGEASDQVDRVLDKLVAAGLVRLTEGEMPGDDQVEVAHEALIRNWPLLVGWLVDERAALRERLRLTAAAEQWLAHGKDPGGLLGGSLLDAALRYMDLNEIEAQFVEASRLAVEEAQREKERAYERELQQTRELADSERRRAEAEKASAWRFRGLAVLTAVVAVIAIAAFDTAYMASKEKAKASEKAAKASEKAAKASQAAAQSRARALQAMKLQPINYVDEKLDLALLLSIEANRMADQPELRRSLLSALNTNLELQSILPGHTDAVRAVAYSPNGKILASASYDETIILWDVTTGYMLHPPSEQLQSLGGDSAGADK
jgi:energy-coupling factor transporter ATP-binding protein EcfA2